MKAVVWIRNSLMVLVLLLGFLLLGLQLGHEINPEKVADGIYADAAEVAGIQQRWLCFQAAGPSCFALEAMAEQAVDPAAPASALLSH